MARVDFSFSGWVRGANIKQATNHRQETVDVSEMPAQELLEKLKTGELFITLGDFLYANNQDSEIEMTDWQVTQG